MIAMVLNVGLFFDRMVEEGVSQYAREKANDRWASLVTIPHKMVQPGIFCTYHPEGVVGAIWDAATEQELLDSQIPAVNVSDYLPVTRLPTISIDDPKVGEAAAEYFLARGYYHFAFASESPNVGYALTRGRHFAARVKAAGHRVIFWQGGWLSPLPDGAVLATGDATCMQWLINLPKPVAIFAAEDRMASILYESARAAKLHIPEQVSILGVDNDPSRHYMTAGISSIELPMKQVGYDAAAMLDQLLDGRDVARSRALLPPLGVVTRESSDTQAIGDPDVLEALRFIRDNAQHMIEVGTVADAVAIGRRSLERRFQAALGFSPRDEIRRVCMAHACALLSSTILGVDEIARVIGFQSRSQFFTSFRKTMGMTPAQYRTQNRLR